MANFRSQNIFSSYFSIFFSLFHFCTIFIPGASYDLPDHYFISCGSAHAQQRFTGDGFYSLDSKQVADNLNSSADDLYRNARIFQKRSWYEFSLNESGIYVVRLHFFPFPSMGNLSHARFSVSASHFLLLSNLDFGNKTRSNPLVEEFFFNVSKSKLRIDFVPDKEEHSFAFVNAIEVFLAPPNFIPDSATDGVVNFPLRVVHRINVGGGDVTRDTDTMLRYWIPDDPYLHLNNTARNSSYSGKIEYKRGLATQFDAPDSVYNTAKELNVAGDNRMTNFNISWRFDVRNGAQHLLRLHFCDIVSVTSDEELKFNLYINSNSFFPISPYERSMNQLAVPFYNDYVVNSVGFGLMNISVGPDPGSQVRTAFLNGVEIMEVLRDRDGDSDSDSDSTLLVVVGCVVLVVMMLTVLIICLRKKKWKPVEEASEWAFVKIRGGSSHSKTSRSSVKTVTGSVHADLNLGLKVPLSAILFATRRFDAKLMIGEGGFGKVYKGKMRNGTKVAVKRSEAGHGQGLPEFQTEIMVLSKICHHHLVSLIGYCDEKNEMIVVYEFMEKGSLRDHLYKFKSLSAPSCRFSWEQRLRICIGAAKGLHYLHTGSVETIVHRDVKSTNILLDENYVAKVSDFGLSRTGSLDQTHFSTEVKGSFGYLDPEYYTSLQLTQKSDVYSFGVVLLEVLCARPAVDPSLPEEQVNLADWGVSCKKKGELESIVDPFLLGKIEPNSLRVFGQTVEQCLQISGGDRPYMSDVLWSLEYCLQFQNSGAHRQPYEDSATDVSLGLPARFVRRLPSNSMSISEDEVAFRHCSFSDESELSAR